MLWFSVFILIATASPDCASSVSASWRDAENVFEAFVTEITATNATLFVIDPLKGRREFSLTSGSSYCVTCSVIVDMVDPFPVPFHHRGVFFTNAITVEGLTFRTTLISCGSSGEMTDQQVVQLRSGNFASCKDPQTSKVYRDGVSWPSDCNKCVCDMGEISCTELACDTVGACLAAEGWVSDGGVVEYEDCRCRCDKGTLKCIGSCADPTSTTVSSKKKIGIAMGFVVAVLLMTCLIIVARRRSQVENENAQEIVLEDVSRDASFSVQHQPIAYNPLPTVAPTHTSVVMLTQTGEPVLVQVTYV